MATAPVASINTTQSPAGALIIQDQLRKIIKKHGGYGFTEAKNDPRVPRASHSPFGDFPTGYKVPKKAPQTTFNLQPAVQSALAASSAQILLKKGQGSGGQTSSLKKGKEKAIEKPSVSGAYRKRQIIQTEFRRFYERGDLPIAINHTGSGNKIMWKVGVEHLDYHHYLPIFFDGLREKQDPYRFLAVQGVFDMLDNGGAKILPVIPQLIIPVKTALNTRDADIMCVVLKVLQRLVTSADMIGEALVPYYRQILPIFNIFKNKNVNSGDLIDYNQRKRTNLGELVQETLELFEQTGGEDAFINIKYMIPTYESCVLN